MKAKFWSKKSGKCSAQKPRGKTFQSKIYSILQINKLAHTSQNYMKRFSTTKILIRISKIQPFITIKLQKLQLSSKTRIQWLNAISELRFSQRLLVQWTPRYKMVNKSDIVRNISTFSKWRINYRKNISKRECINIKKLISWLRRLENIVTMKMFMIPCLLTK